MRTIRRFLPSPALAVACAALLVALGETGWATVSQLAPRNSVGTPQLRSGAVTTGKLRNRAVTTPKLRNRAVTGAKLRPGAVTLAHLAANARIPGPQGPPGPAGTVTRLWAVMNSTGNLARTTGATGAGRLGEGSYEVVFNQSVAACAYVATLGQPGTAAAGAGEIGVSQRAGNANAVHVRTRNSGGVLADRSFHLLVVC